MTKEEKDMYFKNQGIKITSVDDNTPFVFISYKSDNFEEVFDGCVKDLYNQGIKFFSDERFKEKSFNWTDTMMKNMGSPNCKCVLAFLSNEYIQSYATLMELLFARMMEKCVILIHLYDNVNKLAVNPGGDKLLQPQPTKTERNVLKKICKDFPESDAPYMQSCKSVASLLGLALQNNNGRISTAHISSSFHTIIDAV